MSTVPAQPKIYHITHVNNLGGIAADEGLFSDAARIQLNVNCELVGLSGIKQRRLEKLFVKCHVPTKVGEYVPFYFSPRSIMLYIFYMNNHPELTYHGGQGPMVHLQADLYKTIAWAEQTQRKWAFTNGNAATSFTPFFKDRADLVKVNWDAVATNEWSAPDIKEAKQAEFLVKDFFDWHLVERIGVRDQNIAAQAAAALGGAGYVPPIAVEPGWYY